jgi:hypothetical protein
MKKSPIKELSTKNLLPNFWKCQTKAIRPCLEQLYPNTIMYKSCFCGKRLPRESLAREKNQIRVSASARRSEEQSGKKLISN